MKFYDQIIRVDVNKVKANSYNPFRMDEAMMQKEIASIKKDGFVGAIEVRNDPNQEGNYIIVDGEQRYTAAKKLGYTEIPIIITDKDNLKDAKITTIKRNTLKGNVDTIKMAALITNLMEEGKMTVRELSEELGWSDDTIQRLAELDNDIPEMKNTEEIEPTEEKPEDKQYKLLLTFNEEQWNVLIETLKDTDGETNAEKIINLCENNK